MFKIDILQTSRGRRYANATLGRLSEIYENLDKVNCFCSLEVR